MNIFGLIIIFLGAIMITIGYQKSKCICENKVEYRFVPRTFREEQENPVKPSEIFRDMFEQPSPFIKDRTLI
jgi:hypothetical protein